MRLIIILLSICSVFTYGQEKVFEISEVVNLENTNVSELYTRGRQWFISSFNDSNSVIQLDDPNQGIIIGKGNFSYEPTIFSGSNLTRGRVNFVISLELKEGRYRYILKDFTHYGKVGTETDFGVITDDIEFPYGKLLQGSQKWKSRIWIDIKEQVLRNSEYIISSLKDSMEKPSITTDEDW
jgi:hypothetical protein